MHASLTIRSDDTTDYGTLSAIIYKNNNIWAANEVRTSVAEAQNIAANAAVALKVAAGDVIKMECYGTKYGNKRVYFRLIAQGCTLTES